MAVNLVEREYRKRMLIVSKAEVRTPPVEQPKQVEAPRVSANWTSAYLATVGALAGFLGSVFSLAFNVVGAWLMGIEPLKLLRVYATLRQGASALDPQNNPFLADALFAHLAVGSFFGAVFVLMMREAAQMRTFMRHVVAGVLFGLALWIVNFYLILAWLQPIINGDALIVKNIPWPVAILTHVCYGLTVALVSFPFGADVD